jgi:hypothetical protein
MTPEELEKKMAEMKLKNAEILRKKQAAEEDALLFEATEKRQKQREEDERKRMREEREKQKERQKAEEAKMEALK